MYNQRFNRGQYDSACQTLLEHLRQSASIRQFCKAERIVFELGSEVIQLIDGYAKVSAYHENGKEKLLYILSEGDLMGEIDVFVEPSPDIAIIALTDVKAIVISRSSFRSILADKPILYENLLISLIRKYQILRSQISDMVFRDAKGKLASFLLGLSSQVGEECKDRNSKVYYIKYIKHQDIGALIGCSRVTVTRILQEFIDSDAISIQEDCFVILDEEKLRTYL